MKTTSFIKKAVLFVSLFTFTHSSYSQTLYALKIDRKIRNEAIDITAQYQPRLVMSADQALEFQNTVARFLVKKKAVYEDTSLSPSAQYEILKQLSSKETSAMAMVLESFRLQEYMRIKNEIQPLERPPRKTRDILAIK